MKKSILIIISIIAGITALIGAGVLVYIKVGHDNWKVVEQKDATCTEDGYKIYENLSNGKKKTETIPALGHDYIVIDDVPSTCIEEGVTIKRCSRCEEEIRETKPLIEHNYEKSVVSATCTEDETNNYTCSNCGHAYSETVPGTAMGHDYVIVETIPATCTENGLVVKRCSRGDAETTEHIPAITHNYEKTIIPATCTEDEVNSYTCSNCGYTYSETISGTATGHDYEVLQSVPATCTQRGYEFLVCKKDRDNYIRYSDALGHVWELVSTIDPTYTTDGKYSYRCARCKEEKTETIPKFKYDLAINHYYGFSNEYFDTVINTQDNTGYSLGETSYFTSKDALKPIIFSDELAFQKYYIHSILSGKPLSTTNGKVYNVDAGFKASFSFNFPNETFTQKRIENYSEYLSCFDSLDYLRIVYTQYADESYFKIYEVIDFSESFIEISKLVDGEYVCVGSVKTTDDWDAVLGMKEIVFSDKNNLMFFESGTYRIMYKSSVSWFIEASSGAIYNGSGEECHPFGFFNDQYDYFYINVTEDTYNVLLPDDLDEEKDMFYQLYFSDTKGSAPFIKSGDRIDIGEQFKLCVNSKLTESNGRIYYQGKRLDEWKLTISIYDLESDSYIETQLIDLLSKVDGDKIWIIQPKNYTNEGNCKIQVTYSFYDAEIGETESRSEVYYLYIV